MRIVIAMVAVALGACGQPTTPSQVVPPSSITAPPAAPVIGLLAPFPAGLTATVLHGYNDPLPGEACAVGNAARDHCDNQRYGFDLEIAGSDRRIVAPVDGTVTLELSPSKPPPWPGPCLVFTADDGLNIVLCHFGTWAIAQGTHVGRGCVLGTRDTDWIHVSIDDRRSGKEPYAPVAFIGEHRLEGIEYPDKGVTMPDQYHAETTTTVTSTNAARTCGVLGAADTPSPTAVLTPTLQPMLTLRPTPTPTPTPTLVPTPTPTSAAVTCASLRSAAATLTPGTATYRTNLTTQLAFGCAVYMSTDTELHLVDTSNGQDTLVGTYTITGMFDIAGGPGGVLFGSAHGGSELVRIDPWTAATTDIGPTGAAINGLAFGRDGTLFGSGSASLYRLDQSTGATTEIGPTGGFLSAGDITVAASGVMYFASGGLMTMNPATGAATAVGTTSISCLYGLSATPTGLYGGTCNGEFLKIDPATGTVTMIASGLPAWYGMG